MPIKTTMCKDRKLDHVNIPVTTFAALIRCRNELYDIYKQFGGIANIQLSKGLSADVNWKDVNNWEIDNMDEDDPVPKKGKVKPAKDILLDPYKIADSIVDNSNLNSAIRHLYVKEMRVRIEDLFRNTLEVEDDEPIAGKIKMIRLLDEGDSLNDVIGDFQSLFGLNFGPVEQYKTWFERITLDEMLNVLSIVKDEMKEIEMEEG